VSEEELKPVPSKGWAAMIRKVYEVDPMRCPKCGGSMKVVAFITDYAAVDRIIDYLKPTFVAEKPPPVSSRMVALSLSNRKATTRPPMMASPARVLFRREKAF